MFHIYKNVKTRGKNMVSFNKQYKDVEYIIRKGVYGVVFANEKVLMIRSNTKYIFPGGGMNKGETLSACLKREFFEELKAKNINIISYIGAASFFDYIRKLDKNFEMIGYFFEIFIDEISLDKNTIWIKLKDIDNFNILPHHRWAINKLIRMKKPLLS